MTRWTLESAKNGFSEVVRRALSDGPQVVVRGRRQEDAVVIVRLRDYEQLVAPRNTVDFLRASPLAAAIAAGSYGSTDPFARDRDMGRDVEF